MGYEFLLLIYSSFTLIKREVYILKSYWRYESIKFDTDYRSIMIELFNLKSIKIFTREYQSTFY